MKAMTHVLKTRSASAPALKVGSRNDVSEHEADRAASAVTSGGRVPSWSIGRVNTSPSGNTVQRDGPDPSQQQTPPKPDNYDDAAKKAAEAFMKTDTGKKLEQAVKDDPVVKGATDFVGTLPGKIIVGATGTVAALAATHKPLPMQLPSIPLDVISPKLKDMSLKLDYEGPVDKPTKAMLTFSYTPGGDKKKKKDDTSAQIKARTQALRASLDMFRPKDDSVDQAASAASGRLAPYAKKPPADAPVQAQQQTPLDKKLDLKPADAPPAVTNDKDKKEDAPVQRKATDSATDAGPASASSSVENVLQSSGTPLDRGTRSFFESRFGHDFSKVRIHTGAEAASSARDVAAKAYTVGDKIVFNSGQYSHNTQEGRKLLAHELTHVVQQGNPEEASASSRLALGAADHSSEPEADSATRMVGSGWSFGASGMGIASRKSQPVVQRAPDEWSHDYDVDGTPELRSHAKKTPFEQFKAGLGEVRPTTQGGLSQNLDSPRQNYSGTGRKAAPEITMPVLMEIYPALAADIDENKAKTEEDKEKAKTRKGQAEAYLANLNQAFRIMQIDSVEAQANYLAHAFVESGQFRAFTESQAGVDNGAHMWTDDPTQVPLNKSALPKDKDVNPHGNFEFIGRGPVQVTHRSEYVETIAMLEKAAEQYEKDAKQYESEALNRDVKEPPSDWQANSPTQQGIEAAAMALEKAKVAREAATAVKADPRQAANPKYAFLFSAAFMKKRGADVSVAYGPKEGPEWVGDDPKTSWVAGGKQKAGSPQADALVDKGKAYERIYNALMKEAKKASKSAP